MWIWVISRPFLTNFQVEMDLLQSVFFVYYGLEILKMLDGNIYIYIWLMTKINDGFSMISLIRTLPGGAFPGWFHANFDGNSDGKVALISMMVISFSKGCMGWRTSVPSCWSYQDWTPSRNTNTQKKADVSKKSKKTALLKRTVHNFRILKGGDGNPSFHFLKAVSSFFQRNSSKAATLVFPSPPLCVQWAFLGDKNEPK